MGKEWWEEEPKELTDGLKQGVQEAITTLETRRLDDHSEGRILSSGRVLIASDIHGIETVLSPERAYELLDLLSAYRDMLYQLRKEGTPMTESRSEPQAYTLYWHPSEMYTARLAYGNDTALWGSERLELKQGDRWIPGNVGQLVPGGGLVLWPQPGMSDQEYLTLTVDSVVRNVSKPVGDGGGPSHE